MKVNGQTLMIKVFASPPVCSQQNPKTRISFCCHSSYFHLAMVNNPGSMSMALFDAVKPWWKSSGKCCKTPLSNHHHKILISSLLSSPKMSSPGRSPFPPPSLWFDRSILIFQDGRQKGLLAVFQAVFLINLGNIFHAISASMIHLYNKGHKTRAKRLRGI